MVSFDVSKNTIEYSVKIYIFGLDKSGDLRLANSPFSGGQDFSHEVTVEDDKSSFEQAVRECRSGYKLSVDYLELIDFQDPAREIGNSRKLSAVYAGLTSDTLTEDNSTLVRELDYEHQRKAFKQVGDKMQSKNLAVFILPKAFSLSQLYSVYCQFWPERKLDLPNFRRKMTKSGTIQDTGQKIQGNKMYVPDVIKTEIYPPISRRPIRRV